MTTLPPAYPTLEQEPNQEATNPAHLDKLEMETNNTYSNDTKRTVLGIVYVLLMVYAGISIFFSIIFGIIGLCFAFYAWYEYRKYGNPKNYIISAVVSFLFSTVSYLTTVVIVLLNVVEF